MAARRPSWSGVRVGEFLRHLSSPCSESAGHGPLLRTESLRDEHEEMAVFQVCGRTLSSATNESKLHVARGNIWVAWDRESLVRREGSREKEAFPPNRGCLASPWRRPRSLLQPVMIQPVHSRDTRSALFERAVSCISSVLIVQWVGPHCEAAEAGGGLRSSPRVCAPSAEMVTAGRGARFWLAAPLPLVRAICVVPCSAGSGGEGSIVGARG